MLREYLPVQWQRHAAFIRDMRERGVRFVAGSDGFSGLEHEYRAVMELMVRDVGLTPLEVIHHGTGLAAEALEIANDTMYGLGAGVWTRDMSKAFRMGRGIKAGRVWTNCYHLYPAHAAFGGYKNSGVGRENHRMMLDHYSQTKCLLVSYDPSPLGFF